MSPTKIVLSALTFACITTAVSAMEFQVLGAKATSMGGAGIATSPSSLASYNNPALLANNPEKFSIHIGGGVGLKDTGAGKSMSELSKLDFSGVSALVNGNANNASAGDIATLTQAQGIIKGMNQKGFGVNPTVDLALSYGAFGTGVFLTSDIGGIANIDQSHMDLIFETSTPGTYMDIITSTTKTLAEYQATSLDYAVKNGLTNVDVVGLAVAEIPLAYGYAIKTEYGLVSVGGAAKIMSGKSFYKKVTLDNTNSLSNISQNALSSTTLGLDLGTTFVPKFSDKLTLAAVGKNLNTPSFDRIDGGKYELKPAVRIGSAYKVADWIELALDADLTNNKSLTGYNTRYIGGGVNFDLSALELNAGLMKNTASNDLAGLIYTAGIATGPDWLHLELSAQMASKSGQIDGTSYPMQALVNFAVSSAW
ncbi:MAG: conjugal transfer protein TraF [Sulfuricurvum sp.]|nr:conjugal transfer protein TraF [Sulfuricurvum sp.]